MKIAFVFDDGLDKPDGVQQCVLHLGEWLRAQGEDVHYIVGQTTRTDIQNVHVAARNIPVSFNGNKLTIPLPASKRRMRQILADIQPDVLHVQVPYSPFMGAMAISCASPAVGVVGTFHVLPYNAVARWATRALGIWLRPTLRRFSAMYAASPAATSFASWSMGVPVATLQHSIDIQPFVAAKTSRGSDTLQLVFLGRLVERKGAWQLVQAINGLSAATKQRIHVRLGGRGDQLEQIQRYIVEHNLAETIQLDGFISEADKPHYLAAADIAIFPSISGESFGISLIEPMAAGAGVVVGGDNPGYRSILGDWPEALLDAKNIPAFTAYLEALIGDDALRARLHDLQQAAVPLYDVNVVGRQWQRIYRESIARTQGS